MLAIPILLTIFGVSNAAPVLRRVTLDAAATAEAQKIDATATRAFTATSITTSDGQCLLVESGSGDFRENLNPVLSAACDGSAGQQWDVITAGVHNDVPGTALIVSSLTNACLNFDPRRAAGDQVNLFSCGGRADGGGTVTNSQQFAFNGTAGPLALVPQNSNDAVCLTAVDGGRLDQTACDPETASGAELFTFGGAPSSQASPTEVSSAAQSSTQVEVVSTAAPVITAAPASTTAAVTPTSAEVVTVSRAGVVLDPSAVVEAQVRDDTATRAASDVQVQTSDGQCLSVDATAGDFRENLIPVTIGACDGSAGQKFDVITAGVHNNVSGAALVVSTLTQGCLNFDPRRAAGDQVILFSCGGRADGEGLVTNSQLFTFTGGNGPLPLVPQNAAGTCLVNNAGKLDNAACDDSEDQLFTFA